AGDERVWARADLKAGVVLREARGSPTPPVMALRAALPQVQAHMIHSAGAGADHVRHVATQARDGGANEAALPHLGVTFLAGKEGMPAHQGKIRSPVRVGIKARLPVRLVVTPFTPEPEAPGVGIAMATVARPLNGRGEA